VFVANGVNWTGNFWTASINKGSGLSSGGVSFFTGRNPFLNNKGPFWSGLQFNWSPGLSIGSKGNSQANISSLLDKVNNKTLGLNFNKSYFYLLYGNGSDFLEHNRNNVKDNENVNGWHFWNPIDPADNTKN
jgi:hypothetical protein